MDELAVTVSNILNNAANGIGDISQWLASNGLPGYASVNIAQWVVYCVFLFLIFVPVMIICIILWKKGIDIYSSKGDGFFYILAGGALTFFDFIIFLALFNSVVNLTGWMVSPDGMLLKILTESVIK